jgi:hypothetical protein
VYTTDEVAEIRSRVAKVRFTESLYQAMALRARAEERTISEWIRLLVAAKLKGQEVSPSLTGSQEPDQHSESSDDEAGLILVGAVEGGSSPKPLEVGSDEWADLLARADSFEEDGR